MAVTQGLGDGFALYNGVKLPNIESVWTDELKAQYPYASLGATDCSIFGYAGKFVYSIAFSSVCCQKDGEYYKITGQGIWYMYTDSDEVANIFEITAHNLVESERFTDGTESTTPFIWSNHDVIDVADNSVVLAASDPIPLDGMHVIEWDGDTTGLENVYEMQYKVSDAILRKGDFTNSVVVITYTDRAQVTQGDTVFEGEGVVFPSIGGEPIDGVVSVYVEDVLFGMGTGLWFGNTEGVAYTSLFAYTTTSTPSEPEEPETPKWQFSLRDFLSGVAAGAASRGVLPRQKKEAIAYLYNGVQLPGLPEVEGQYMVIDYDSGEYLLIPCSHPLIRKSDGNIYQAEIATYYVYKVINGEWSTYSGNQYKIEQVVFGTAIWANTDILNEDGSVYLAASEPVPIYE